MISFELDKDKVTFRNNSLQLSMIRSKTLKKILKINDWHKGYIAADCVMSNSNKPVEEYFDFEDVLRDLRLLKLKDQYFKGIKKENICIINK